MTRLASNRGQASPPIAATTKLMTRMRQLLPGEGQQAAQERSPEGRKTREQETRLFPSGCCTEGYGPSWHRSPAELQGGDGGGAANALDSVGRITGEESFVLRGSPRLLAGGAGTCMQRAGLAALTRVVALRLRAERRSWRLSEFQRS